ncbi:MAG: hypothetical protein IKE29_22165, partial [Paenibacillus sp.]|uniref:hypothetical protein n=1 Tax=Paenibacillus sp. TaxID=58172 RepID=UPI0025FEBAC2
VKPKADVYIAKGIVPQDILEERNFYLNEDDVETFNLVPIAVIRLAINAEKSENVRSKPEISIASTIFFCSMENEILEMISSISPL